MTERRARVGVRIDGDGRDAHAPRGLDDAASDLAVIGDQDFLEHLDNFRFVFAQFSEKFFLQLSPVFSIMRAAMICGT